MNPFKTLLHTTLFALSSCVVGASAAGGETSEEQTLYGAGSQKTFKGPADLFTGDVSVQMLFPENDTAHFSGAYVTFAPGARTNWHEHPAGQHMIVTDGTALTGTRDGKVLRFAKGETVWCPPDVDHWHGATPHKAMTHLVITGSRDGKNVTWKEKVTDEQYLAGQDTTPAAKANVAALPIRQQLLVPIAAFTANGDLESLKTAISRGLDTGLTINEIKEAQIHLYAYVGFPRALNGLGTLMAVVEERKTSGTTDPVGDAPQPFPAGGSSREIGKAVQTGLAGKPVTGPLFDFAPGINELLQSHLFGDLFARGILDKQDREVVTVSALSGLSGAESQLQAHIRISTNAGLSTEQLRAVAAVLNSHVGTTQGRSATQAIDAVLDK